jgi:hypothetical protein
MLLATLLTGITMIYGAQYVFPALEPILTATAALPPALGSIVWLLIVVPVWIGAPMVLFFAIFHLLLRATGEKP